jgi:hypothetical protein
MIASAIKSPQSAAGVLEYWSDGVMGKTQKQRTGETGQHGLQHSNTPALQYSILRLYFRNNHCLGFTDRFAGSAAQAVLRPCRGGLDREIKHIHRAVDDALLAPVTLVGIYVDKIDLIVNVLFSHGSGPVYYFFFNSFHL